LGGCGFFVAAEEVHDGGDEFLAGDGAVAVGIEGGEVACGEWDQQESGENCVPDATKGHSSYSIRECGGKRGDGSQVARPPIS
jgi:hypothetical protein